MNAFTPNADIEEHSTQFRVPIADRAYWDLLTTCLYICFRNTCRVEEILPFAMPADGEGGSGPLTITNQQIKRWRVEFGALDVVDDEPSQALLLALKAGKAIETIGFDSASSQVRSVEKYHWAYINDFGLDAHGGIAGSAGSWSGLLFRRADVMRFFKPDNHRFNHAVRMQIERNLRKLAIEQDNGLIDGVVTELFSKAAWLEAMRELHGVGGWVLNSIWQAVAADFPALSSLKGKRKVRRCN